MLKAGKKIPKMWKRREQRRETVEKRNLAGEEPDRSAGEAQKKLAGTAQKNFTGVVQKILAWSGFGGNRRRLKHGSYSIALSAVVVAGAVVLNVIASELPSQYTLFDMTREQLSVLRDQTKELLDGLSEDVTLYYLVQDSSRDTTVSRLLKRYDDYSDHVTLTEKDPVVYPKFASQYTDEAVTENSVIVVCGDRSRVVPYEDMYESEFNYNYYSYETTGFDAEGQITSAIAALSSDAVPKLYTLTGHGEMALADSLARSIEKENIETDSLNLITADRVPEDADCILIVSPTSDLSQEESEKLLDYLKAGGRAVVITDYTEEKLTNLASVLSYYGTEITDGVIVEGDSRYYVQMPYYLVPEIESTEISADMTDGSAYVLLAAAQGITVSDELRDGVAVTSVLKTSPSAYSKTDVQNMSTYEKEDGDLDGPFGLGVLVTETVELDEGTGKDDAGTEVQAEESGKDDVGSGTQMEELVKEDAETGTQTEKPVKEDAETGTRTEKPVKEDAETGTQTEESVKNDAEEGSQTESDTESAAEDIPSARAAKTAETRLALFTSSALIDESADQMVSGGNTRLFINTLSWACGQSSSVSVPVKSLSVDYLTLTAASSNFWSIVTIVIIPGTFLICGLMIWLRRRRQ